MQTMCSFCKNCNKLARYECVQCDLLLCDNARSIHNKSSANISHHLEQLTPDTTDINKEVEVDGTKKEEPPKTVSTTSIYYKAFLFAVVIAIVSFIIPMLMGSSL